MKHPNFVRQAKEEEKKGKKRKKRGRRKDKKDFVRQVTALLDEQIVVSQAMQFSPFKGPFMDDIEEWATKLMYVSECLENWLKAPRFISRESVPNLGLLRKDKITIYSNNKVMFFAFFVRAPGRSTP